MVSPEAALTTIAGSEQRPEPERVVTVSVAASATLTGRTATER